MKYFLVLRYRSGRGVFYVFIGSIGFSMGGMGYFAGTLVRPLLPGLLGASSLAHHHAAYLHSSPDRVADAGRARRRCSRA
jgi:hypothetical protein